MVDYNDIKQSIATNLPDNNNREITAAKLRSTLNEFVDKVGVTETGMETEMNTKIARLENAGYQFAGVATKDTNPNTPEAKVFYIADGKGVYTNFGGIEVTEGEVAILTYDSSWHKVVVPIEISIPFSKVGSINQTGGVTNTKAAVRTDFIKVIEGIKIKAYDGSSSYPEYAAVTFFDENFTFISCMTFSSAGLKEITLTSSNIPIGAEYFIASTISDHLSQSYVKSVNRNIENITKIEMSLKLNGLISDGEEIFTRGYYSFNNEMYDDPSVAISTDYLPLDGISKVFYWGLMWNPSNKVVIFFDENKQIITNAGVSGGGLLDGQSLSGVAVVPENAKWVIISDSKTSYDLFKPFFSLNSVKGLSCLIGKLMTETSLIESSIDELRLNVEKNKDYSSAIAGVTFGTTEGDIVFKNALKKVWIQILDPSFNATTLKLVHFCNKSNEQLNPMFAFYDQNDEYAISWFDYNTTPRTGVQHIVLGGYGTYNGLFCLHLVIDWDKMQEKRFTTGLQTTINVSELNKVDTDTRTLTEQLTYASNDWKDNTIVCFGDSITEFRDSNIMGYTDYLKQFTGANIINIGIGGTQFRQRAIPVSSPSSDNEAYASLDIINIVKACCEQDFTNQIAANNWLKDKGDNNTEIITRLQTIDWSKVNAVTFFAGTNDWNNAAGQWGESGSSDVNTTLGAINEIIRLLLTTYPHIKIYWFTPIVRWLNERIPENFSDNLVRGTKTLKEFSAMIQTEVVHHHIPICDMYNTLGWNMYNFSNYFTDTDGTHPSKGYMPIARKIKGFIDANRTF